MRELGAAFEGGGPPTPDEIGRIASRYDFQARPDLIPSSAAPSV